MRQAARPSPGRAGVRRIIERPRLIKLLDEATARTILLVAPAGYGKTTLVRQWSELRPAVHLHWYTARSGSADVAQLAVDLATAFDSEPPKLREYVSQLVRARASPADQVAEIVEGFASAAGSAETTALVIDDYHLLAEENVADWFVHELQSRLGFRLVIASRSRPSWATARLEVYGETVEVGVDELALTDDEAQEVLGESPQARGLLSQARGWPAVVALAAQTDKAVSPSDAAGSTLFRFFAEELFLATPERLQDQFLTLALLPSLSRDLVETAVESHPDSVVEQALESGLVTSGLESAELHPLVREYLLAKLDTTQDRDDRVRSAVQLSIDRGYWDHAFGLITRFKAADLLDRFIEATFKPLISSGRVATNEQVAGYGHAIAHLSPVVELIDAELAFRNGHFATAQAIATHAANGLGEAHPLASHAWWIAGQGAQLSFDDATALSHFEKARASASTEDDLREALWGAALTSCQAEVDSVSKAIEPLLIRRNRSPIDRVRATAAEILLERISGSGRTIELADALHALQAISDPRIRSGFMNACAYHLILRGQYDAASELALRLRETVDEFHLAWAQPHSYWALAAAALGRRQMGEASNWLHRVERAADAAQSGPLLLNACCLRARLLLALQQPEAAWSALTIDETLPTNRGMRGEFYATKALTLAVMGVRGESEEFAEIADTLTRCVETQAFIACSKAIVSLQAGASAQQVSALVRPVERMNMWDAFVASVRAHPPLLAAIAERRPLSPGIVAALRNAYDFDLSKQVGLDIGRRPRDNRPVGDLSPREVEVLDLICEGFTNQDIARALFISKATVKVHVGHILEKTGARSRTEIAGRGRSRERRQEPE